MIKDTRQDFITSENEDIRVECTHWAGHKYFTVTLMQFSYNCVCCGVALIQFTNSFENSNLWQSSTTNLVKEKQPRQIRTISAVRDFQASVCVFGLFVASLSAILSAKPGSDSFYRYGNHPWESSTHDHIKTQTISERRSGGCETECEGETGGRVGRRRRWGEWPKHDHIKPHTPYQKDGWGRHKTVIHPPALHVSPSLSETFSFILWLAIFVSRLLLSFRLHLHHLLSRVSSSLLSLYIFHLQKGPEKFGLNFLWTLTNRQRDEKVLFLKC